MGTLRTEPYRRQHVVVWPPAHVGPAWKTVARSATVELVAGVLASLTAIIGLTGRQPVWTAAIATILIGIGLIIRGGAIAARWREVMRQLPGTRETQTGVAIELLAGLASVAFALIAPNSREPSTLIGCATVVIGIALMLASPEQTALAELGPARARKLAWTSSTAMVVIGLTAAILGLLAIVAGDLTLALIALLAASSGATFAGVALRRA